MFKINKLMVIGSIFIFVSLLSSKVSAASLTDISINGEAIDPNTAIDQTNLSEFSKYCTGSINYQPQTSGLSELSLDSVNCNFDSNAINFLQTNGDIKLLLSGNSQIVGSGAKVLISSGSITVEGPGSLHLIYQADDSVDAMELTGSLTINSGTFIAEKSANGSFMGAGIYVDGNIVVNGGLLAGVSNSDAGIIIPNYGTPGDLTVNGGELQAYTYEANTPAIAIAGDSTWTSTTTSILAPTNATIALGSGSFASTHVAYNENKQLANLVVIGQMMMAPQITQDHITQDDIAFSWTAVQAVDGYLVYRQNPDGNYIQLDTLSDSVLTVDDTNLVPDTSYTYKVTGFQTLINGSQLLGTPAEITFKTLNAQPTPSPTPSVTPTATPTPSVIPTVTPTISPSIQPTTTPSTSNTPKPSSTPKANQQQIPTTNDNTNINMMVALLLVTIFTIIGLVILKRKHKK